jgi:hypothetical protein
VRLRFAAILACAAALAASILAGCGGGGSSGGTDPAQAVPADAPVYLEASIHPGGQIAENVDSLAKSVLGVESVGALIAEELEKTAAGEGGELDFEKEIEPWLGDEAGLFLQEYDGEEFHGAGAALQVSDEAEAEEIVDKKQKEGSEPFEGGSYEGVDFESIEGGTTIGFTEGLLLFGETEAIFKRMVKALSGENLASADGFEEATSEVPGESVAHAYVDVGGLIKEAGQGIPAEARLGFELLGIEPEGATALLSLVPGSDHVELDVSSNIATGAIGGGDASKLLGTLPSGSVAAVASSEYGKSLEEAIDRIDENGIPGEVPPHQFKRSLERSGLDLESLVGSIGDVGVFVEGNSERNLGGAVIIESSDTSEAQNTVKNLGLLLRASGVGGVTAYNEGGLSGFSVRSDEFGSRPIVVVAGESKIVISYGPKAAAAALSEKAGTLADDPAFGEAKAALGSTPIAGFLDGPSALTLFNGIASPLEQAELMDVKPYLEKIGYVAFGGSSNGNKTSAKIVAGLGK